MSDSAAFDQFGGMVVSKNLTAEYGVLEVESRFVVMPAASGT